MNITKEKLLEHFDYKKSDGILIWKKPAYFRRTDVIGKIAGGKDGRGYLSVRIFNKHQKVHRLIWFLEKGTWPKMIDHIDGNTLNNHISNLRAANDSTNQQNRKQHRKGKLVGAHWNKIHQVWTSSIRIDKKSFYLGRFKTELEAHQAYLKRARGES